MDCGEDRTTDTPDVEAWAVEIAAEISAAVHADRQDVREEMASAAERGKKGYIPVRRSMVPPSEQQAKWLEELMVAQATKLHEKVASLGLTAEEESLLRAAELSLQRFGPEDAGGQDA